MKIVSLVIIVFLLCLTGCTTLGLTTPQAIHDDLALIKENVQIQKKIADTLLKSVVPQNDNQIEALAIKKLEVEQQFDMMAAAINRLVMYYGSEQQVGYIINILNFMQESSLKNLLTEAETEREYDDLAKEVNFEQAIADLCIFNDNRMPGTTENR